MQLRSINLVIIFGYLIALLGSGCTQTPTVTEIPESATEQPSELIATPNAFQAAMTADAANAASNTTAEPLPTSCADVDGSCILLTFDGTQCIYQGEEIQAKGKIQLLVVNNANFTILPNIIRISSDHSVEELADWLSPAPAMRSLPAWAVIQTPTVGVPAGGISLREKNLVRGHVGLSCSHTIGSGFYEQWFAGGFDVQ